MRKVSASINIRSYSIIALHGIGNAETEERNLLGAPVQNMQSRLEIFYTAGKGDPSTVDICVNDQSVVYTVLSDRYVIECALVSGVHMLSIQLQQPGQIDILDVQLNGAGVRECLYLSYTQTPTERQQPCTALWDTDQTWYLPFGNPMSYWLDCVFARIPHHLIGQTNLYKHFDIWYATQKLQLPNSVTTVVQDFFKHDFGFTVLPKNKIDFAVHPIIPLNIDLSSTTQIVEQFDQLALQPDQVKRYFTQDSYNKKENPNYDDLLYYYVPFFYDSPACPNYYPIPPDQMPALWDFVKQWDIKDIHRINIIVMPPGGYSVPHRDVHVDTDVRRYDGCCQLYIPLVFPQDSYIKLSGVGLVDTTQANAINITEYTHCAVNNSDQIRTVLIIRCNIERNQHLFGPW